MTITKKYLVSREFAERILAFNQSVFINGAGFIYSSSDPIDAEDIPIYGPRYVQRMAETDERDNYDAVFEYYTSIGMDTKKTWVTFARDAITERARRTGRAED